MDTIFVNFVFDAFFVLLSTYRCLYCLYCGTSVLEGFIIYQSKGPLTTAKSPLEDFFPRVPKQSV